MEHYETEDLKYIVKVAQWEAEMQNPNKKRRRKPYQHPKEYITDPEQPDYERLNKIFQEKIVLSDERELQELK
jgi:hypothetical protein